MSTAMLWSDHPRVKYRVTRSAEGYVVERLRKRRVRQDDPHLDYFWYKWEFLPDKTYRLLAPDYRCDPILCAQAYYLGACQHEALVGSLHQSWEQLRADYLKQVRRRLYRLVHRLREVHQQLLDWQAQLALVPESRLIQGTYVVFAPAFLQQFSPRQLVLILQAIRYPLDAQALEDLDQLIEHACAFNAAQHARRKRTTVAQADLAQQDRARFAPKDASVQKDVRAG